MRGLFAKLENPAVTGLSVKFSEAKADVTPTIIPDVYRDEPLVLAAKLDTLAGSVEIKGRVGDRPWSVTLPLQNTAEGNGLSKLWAKRKIADAEVARTLREMTPEDSDKAILALALDHQIVTRLTSPSRSTRRRAVLKASRSSPANCRSTCRPVGISRRSLANDSRSQRSSASVTPMHATSRPRGDRRPLHRMRSACPRPRPRPS